MRRYLSRIFGKQGSYEGESLVMLGFDTAGWQERERSPRRTLWTNKQGDVLSIDCAETAEGPPFSDKQALTRYCRGMAESSGGGIVSIHNFTVADCRTVQLIYKREDGTGYAYTGMLLILVRGCLHVLVAVCRELGTTGIREAVVTAKLAEEGTLELEEWDEPDERGAIGGVKGWFKDPYDPEYKGIVLCSVADDERYDDLFPDHPLSRLRNTLSWLRETLKPIA